MDLFKTTRRVFLAAILSAFVGATDVGSAPARADEPEYQAISNVVYKKVGDREIKLNLFLPLENGQVVKGRPLLIYLDSGCWYSGEPGDGGFWKAHGARRRGFAIASVSHRPINEAVFPAPMEDVRAATRFLRKHADEYGYDPTRFAVMGCSSGGNLALSLGVSDEKTPFNVGDNLDVSGQVQRVIDFYGPADFEDIFRRYPVQALDCVYAAFGAKREAGDPNDPGHAELMEKARLYSPINYVDKNFAPTLVLHGTMDWAVPFSQSALLYESLTLHGVRSQFYVSDGGVHDVGTIGSPNLREREIFEFLQW